MTTYFAVMEEPSERRSTNCPPFSSETTLAPVSTLTPPRLTSAMRQSDSAEACLPAGYILPRSSQVNLP